MPDASSSRSAAPRAVFVSYSHEDAAAARRTAEALRAAGLEVWFDESELRSGDTWDASIKQQIRDCALFLPIISQNTQHRREGYFRLEWHLAEERTRLIARGTPFLVPVAIDDITERGALVPEVFLSVQWTRLPGGEATAAFADRVKTLLAEDVNPVADRAPTQRAGLQPKVGRALRARHGWAAALAIAVAFGIFAWSRLQPQADTTSLTDTAARRSAPPTPAATAPAANDKSIAILPFANLSPDRENEFFADGMHADLLSNLLGLRELRVISAQSVSGYRGTTKRIPEIARELGVAYVLTGSVRRAGDTFRVSAQLIDARTDSPLWSPQPYTRKLTDVFALQSELAQSIASELKATLSPEEKKLLERRPTENLAAYDLFVKAREVTGIFESTGRETLVAKVHTRDAFLQAAVRLDPKFASAWAALASNHFNFIATNTDRSPARYALAKTAIERAIHLEPDSPDVINSHVYYLGRTNADRGLIAEQIERLLKIAPNTAGAYSTLSGFQFGDGRYAEAVMNIQKAARLDPRNTDTSQQEVSYLWRVRRYAEATEARRRLLTLRPATVEDRFAGARMAFQASGSTREMESLAQEFAAKEPDSADAVRTRLLSALWRRDWEEAMRFDRKHPPATTAEPGNAPGFVNGDGTGDMALIHLSKGDVEAARRRLGNFPALLRAHLDREPNNTRVIRYLATLEAIVGNRESAVRLAEQSLQVAGAGALTGSSRQNAREVLAQVCAIVGDKDRAIAELSHLLNTPSQVNIHELKVMPVYFNLGGYPRFEALVNDPKNNAPLF